MKKKIITTLSSLCLLMAILPAQAATQRSADFSQGQTLGVGLYGASYDAGLGPISLGASLGMNSLSSYSSYSPSSLNLGSRVLWRFMENKGISAAVMGGVHFVPGSPGDTARFIPDAGLSIAYNLREFDWPWAFRMNLSLALNNTRGVSTSNFFQYLTVGPHTSFEVAYIPNDDFEFTLGGGTLLGVRMKF